MCFDFIFIEECYKLQYVIEPNKFVYFCDIVDDKLKCTDCKSLATSFNSRKIALFNQSKIKDIFGLEFQIIKEV